MSKKEKLMALSKIRRDPIEIDGETYLVQEIGSSSFSDYGIMLKNGDKVNATAYLISECVVDENGDKVLTAEEAICVAKSARVAMPIVSKIMELSGFKGDDAKQSDAG